MESPQRATIPEKRHPRGMFILTVDDQQPVTERDVPRNRNAFGPHGHRRHGLIRRRTDPVTIDLELDGHTNDESRQRPSTRPPGRAAARPTFGSRILADLPKGSNSTDAPCAGTPHER